MNLMEVEAGRGNCDCDAVPFNLGVYLGGEHAAQDEPDGGGGGSRQLRQ